MHSQPPSLSRALKTQRFPTGVNGIPQRGKRFLGRIVTERAWGGCCGTHGRFLTRSHSEPTMALVVRSKCQSLKSCHYGVEPRFPYSQHGQRFHSSRMCLFSLVKTLKRGINLCRPQNAFHHSCKP